MQFITTSLLILTLSVYCSAISVGFKSNYKENSVLIIGEVTNTASSVQIANILHQLQVFKNLYTKVQNEIMIPVTVGNRMKVSRRLSNAEAACLYDVQCTQFIEFMRSKVSKAVGSNGSIQKSFTFYQKPSLLIPSSGEVPDQIEIFLDEAIIVDINEVFSESMEVSYNSRSMSPILEYDDIYETGQSSDSGLLRKKKRSKKCFENCCCTIN